MTSQAGGSNSLSERARADAEAARRAEAAYVRPPDSGQRQMAHEVAELLGVEIDPHRVVDGGYRHPYYVYSLEVAGLRFVGHYLSDTNGLHRTSSPWTVERRRGGFLRRTETRAVSRIGDLEGWL